MMFAALLTAWPLLLFTIQYTSGEQCEMFDSIRLVKSMDSEIVNLTAAAPSPREGRLEVRCADDGVWWSVCRHRFRTTEGYVACRQLGFQGVTALHSAAIFETGTLDVIALDEIRCSGNEGGIFDCELFDANGECSSVEDVIAVSCLEHNSAACIEGSVRLADGASTSEGRLEVCVNGYWGTVCDDDFHLAEGYVTCNQLGYTAIDEVFGRAKFGEGSGDILLDDVQCKGNELKLLDCNSKYFNDNDCDHSEDVSIRCSNISECTAGSIRLVDGTGDTRQDEGTVQVCFNGAWQLVCTNVTESIEEAKVICRQHGISNGYHSVYSTVTDEPLPFVLGQFKCSGNENNLLAECSYEILEGSNSCVFGKLGVRCNEQISGNSVLTTAPTNTVPTSSTPVPTASDGNNNTDVLIVAVIGALAIVLLILVTVTALVAVLTFKSRNSVSLETNRKGQRGSRNASVTLSSIDHLDNEYVDLKRREASFEDMFGTSLIEPKDLKLLEKIGQGEFGIVYQGLYAEVNPNKSQHLPKVTPVAVKTLRGIYSGTKIDELYKEAETMKTFDHPHVLTLTGVCIGLLESPCIVMPFMSNGSLLSYLRKEAPSLVISAESADENIILDAMKQLLSIVLQVAKGMAYLSQHKFVHRDLAARNCMISADGVIKVADFGLAEDIYSMEYFKLDKNSEEASSVKLPVKWMALESIHYGKFSEKSDVWSFGVLCWEVFSAGRQPYPGIGPLEVIEMLDNGERLNKPPNQACRKEIYALMLSCWDKNSKSRPSFNELVEKIEDLLVPLADYMDLNLLSCTN